LHNIFRPLPVAAGQPKRIPQQRSRVLGIERADEVFVTSPSPGFAPLDASVLRHIWVTAHLVARFISGAGFWLELRDIAR
jgi:hypothetical protein